MAGTLLLSVICFGSLTMTLGANLPKARAAGHCNVATHLPPGGQRCVSLLFGIEDDGLAQKDVCQILTEVLVCVKTRATENHQTCAFGAVKTAVLGQMTSILPKLHLDQCSVSEPSDSLCHDSSRLSVIGSALCGAYLRSADSLTSTEQCQAAFGYTSCVHRNIQYAKCTNKQIEQTTKYQHCFKQQDEPEVGNLPKTRHVPFESTDNVMDHIVRVNEGTLRSNE